MSEPSVPHVDLEAGLREYFAVTTPTELPRSISRMNVRSLQERRGSRLGSLAAGAFGVIVAVALGFVVLARPGSQSATSSSTSFSGIAGSAAPDMATPVQGDRVSYPGVDGGKLAASGVVLRVPVGRAAVSLGPVQAQAAAVQAVGGTGARPGPAVLATVDLLGGQQTTTCLCWVVEVPVSRLPLVSPGAASQPRTELVLVDAADGRIVATLTGHGIP